MSVNYYWAVLKRRMTLETAGMLVVKRGHAGAKIGEI